MNVGRGTVALAVALSACATAVADDVQTVRGAIHRGNTRYIETMAQADAKAFATVYDPRGARLSGNGQITRGRAAIEEQVRDFFERNGPVEVTIETVDLWVLDDRAYETGEWTYSFTPPGDERQVIGGLFVTVWKRQTDGGWKIVADMGVPGTNLEDARE